MPKSVTATEAKNSLGSLMGWVVEHGDEVIVENHGEPRAVIISFEAYQEMQVLKEQQRRQEVLARVRQLRTEIRARNTDIQSDEEAMAIADRFQREVIDEMVDEGIISFEQDA